MELMWVQIGLFLLLAVGGTSARRFADDNPIRMPTQVPNLKGTRWALLVAGSSGYGNYRHQADVCHAYQILRRNGLKEENIVVMMFDDIANHTDNPRKGTVINHPQGSDVYAGVPKDYTGDAVTASNFFAVLLGDKSATVGGTGKVIDSGPEDHVFLFYSDHGGAGVLGMPSFPFVFANDLVDTLTKKHASGGYKEMVIYLEACESGSIFEGLLPEGLNIYVTTASGPQENSWGTYCPGTIPSPPPEFDTCLGDLYSVSWMEDSEVHNLKRETLLEQYLTVKDRTSNHNTYQAGSHVMQYGDVELNKERLSLFLGFDPANVDAVPSSKGLAPSNNTFSLAPNAVDQRDADLLHLWHKYTRARHGSHEKKEARRTMINVLKHRAHLDESINLIGEQLFGPKDATSMLEKVRVPLVEDWSCLKSMVKEYEFKCGLLGQYGMKHMRAFANMCNSGVQPGQLKRAVEDICA